MDTINKTAATVFRRDRRMQALAASIVLSISFCGTAFAASGELDAKLAIARAQASIDLVSNENPAATHDQAFAKAQQKLADAQAAINHNDDREALWLANESELLANITAGTSKLAALERTRSEVAHDVSILETELRK